MANDKKDQVKILNCCGEYTIILDQALARSHTIREDADKNLVISVTAPSGSGIVDTRDPDWHATTCDDCVTLTLSVKQPR
jgi:hypothetical protein